jgi:ferrous-iron efflux pump FieF
MDAHLTVAEAHEVVERIEASFADAFPDCEVFIHIDPEGRIDEPDNPLVEANELAKLKARAR